MKLTTETPFTRRSGFQGPTGIGFYSLANIAEHLIRKDSSSTTKYIGSSVSVSSRLHSGWVILPLLVASTMLLVFHLNVARSATASNSRLAWLELLEVPLLMTFLAVFPSEVSYYMSSGGRSYFQVHHRSVCTDDTGLQLAF